ncbi:MAG: sugar phosphate isomerase/epimerase [Clostridia bacterium]|nr:sugar phosphate isomerase/epimerase [Clostridia bacterium]
MKLGLQLYSVREDLEKDFLGTLKKVKEIGYEGGELAGLYGKTAKEVKEAFKEADLIPISAHVAYQDLIPNIEETVKIYNEIGCKYIVIPYLPENLRYGTDKYPDVVCDIRKIGEVCAKFGITLLYHNHDFEFAKNEDGNYVLDVLYEEIPENILQTEIDTCWVNVAGENPCDYVRKYTGRAPVVHLKDFYGEKNKNMYKLIGIDSEEKEVENTFEFRPLGYGKQDVQAIVDAAKDAGASWVIAEQDEPSMGKSRMECAEMSYKYMQTIKY